jgi:hypothetical protein
MDYCAPSANTLERSYTCFSLQELQTIATTINTFIKEKKPICIKKNKECILLHSKDHIDITKDKKQLWNEIYSRLDKLCDFEKCWIDTNVLSEIKDKNLRHQLKYFTIKPKIREPGNYWLSTYDINFVMNQYSKLYSSFLFLGGQPCDFYQIMDIPFDKFKNYNKIGVICNHDPHNKSGSHWVAILIDNSLKTIEYYDSTGSTPIPALKTLLNKFKKMYPDYTYFQNHIRHQNKDSECGVYSIYFLVQRLLGYNFEQIIENGIDDDSMVNYRKIIFTD